MNGDAYKKVEEHAAKLSELRAQLARAEEEFRDLIERAALEAKKEQEVKPELAPPVPKPAPDDPPGPNPDHDVKRLSAKTRQFLKYLASTKEPDRGALSKLLTGKDTPEGRKTVSKRIWAFKDRRFIQERPDGGYEVLVPL